MDGLQRIIEAQRDLSFPSGHTGSSFCGWLLGSSDMPREDRGAGFDPGISDHVFKTLCRSALSDGRSAGMITGTLIAVLVCRVYQKTYRKVLES